MSVRVCSPKLFKNLCLSLVSSVPHFFFRTTPLPKSAGFQQRTENKHLHFQWANNNKNIHRKRRTEPTQRRWKFGHCWYLPAERPASVYRRSVLSLCSTKGQRNVTTSVYKYCNPSFTLTQQRNLLARIKYSLENETGPRPQNICLFTFVLVRGMIHVIVLLCNDGMDHGAIISKLLLPVCHSGYHVFVLT